MIFKQKTGFWNSYWKNFGNKKMINAAFWARIAYSYCY
jgi:hypothetical protein